jgi:hypothetical protein
VRWTPPKLPPRDQESVISYWREILAIPDNEPGAQQLREMAAERLRVLAPGQGAQQKGLTGPARGSSRPNLLACRGK